MGQDYCGMELIDVSGNGSRWDVRLDGTLWNNCSVDADCPGRALCALNSSWAAYPALCHCSFTYNHMGSQCSGLGAEGMFYTIVHAILSAIGILLFLTGILGAVHLSRIGSIQVDALSTSLAFATLANLFTAMLLGSAIRFATAFMPIDVTGKKTDGLIIGFVFQSLSFLFVTISTLNISLVWIEIADRARSMKRMTSPKVLKYRRALAMYYVVFFGLMVVGIAINDLMLSTIPAVIGVLFVMISYLIGFFKMRNMILGLMVTSSQGVSTSVSKEAGKLLRDSLVLIRNAALGISISAFIFIIDVAVWIYFGLFADVPGASKNLIPLTLGWVGGTAANSVIMHYLFTTIQRKRVATGVAAVAVSDPAVGKSGPDNKESAAQPELALPGSPRSLRSH